MYVYSRARYILGRQGGSLELESEPTGVWDFGVRSSDVPVQLQADCVSITFGVGIKFLRNSTTVVVTQSMQDEQPQPLQRISPAVSRSTPARGVPPRKKACRQCSVAKTRCDLRRPSCARCQRRGHFCYYTTVNAHDPMDATRTYGSAARNEGRGLGDLGFKEQSATDYGTPSSLPLVDSPGNSAGTFRGPAPNPSQCSSPATGNESSVLRGVSEVRPGILTLCPDAPLLQHLAFSDLELVPSTDTARIRNRWLDSFIPLPDQTLKEVSPPTAIYITRVLKSYPKMMLKAGGLPPMIHPLQRDPEAGYPVPLANCFSLVRMWERRAPGSEALVTETVRREMERLIREVNPTHLLILAPFHALIL
jgi:hypothetical protein